MKYDLFFRTEQHEHSCLIFVGQHSAASGPGDRCCEETGPVSGQTGGTTTQDLKLVEQQRESGGNLHLDPSFLTRGPQQTNITPLSTVLCLQILLWTEKKFENHCSRKTQIKDIISAVFPTSPHNQV